MKWPHLKHYLSKKKWFQKVWWKFIVFLKKLFNLKKNKCIHFGHSSYQLTHSTMTGRHTAFTGQGQCLVSSICGQHNALCQPLQDNIMHWTVTAIAFLHLSVAIIMHYMTVAVDIMHYHIMQFDLSSTLFTGSNFTALWWTWKQKLFSTSQGTT